MEVRIESILKLKGIDREEKNEVANGQSNK